MSQHANKSPFLNQIELSRRWFISPRTLERWRYERKLPSYIKIGNRVLYRLEEVERCEALKEKNGEPW